MSFRLGSEVLLSGFRPTWLIGVWRGGAPPGIALQEFLKVHGVTPDHISIRTSSYTAIGQQSDTIRVHGLEYVVKNANAGDRLLIVDDIFDTGRTVKAVVDKLQRKMRANAPEDIRVATLFWKPHNNQTSIEPSFFVEETDRWICLPHELQGMTIEEITRFQGPAVAALLTPEFVAQAAK